MDMRYVRCDLCDEDNTKLLFYDNNFNLVKCKICGLVYINPRPSSEELKEMYNGINSNNAYYLNYLKNEMGLRWEARRFIFGIKKIITSGKFLDIGCGMGFLLDEVRLLGYDAYGLEIQKKFALYAKSKLNLKVWDKPLEDIKFPDDFFDVVCMLDIISHLESPKKTLKEVYRILKKGGLLLIKTGNKGEFETKRKGELWSDTWGSPQHLYHFSRKTLRQLLFKTGFKIRIFRSMAKIPSVYYFIRRKDIQSKKSSLFIIKKSIYPYYAKIRNLLELTLCRILGRFKINSIVIIQAIKE